MGRKWRCLLIVFIVGMSWSGLCQTSGENPPPPIMATQEESTLSPCGSGDGGQTGGIPPPKGLCLPINDYLIPLFLSGVCLGAFSLYNFQKKKEVTVTQ